MNRGKSIYSRARQAAAPSQPQQPSVVPACEHDWRVDPNGWQPAYPWATDDVVRKEYRRLACAKCGEMMEEHRSTNTAQDWPKVEE